jgi:hypothetical protein
VAALAGPGANAVSTTAQGHSGSIVTAGPAGSSRGPGGATGNAGGNPGGAAGGLLNGSTSTAEINALLTSDAGSYTWVAAAIGSNTASGYQLATQLPVMAIGGFNGSDPSPTLAQFKQYVADGEIHYFIGSGGGGMMNAGGSTSSEISTWVSENFTAQTVDGVTLYDLSGGIQ